MAGINQLPAGVEGVAAFALIYSSVSLICSGLLIWCARLHRETWSYISLLAYFALISNTASIIQQAYDITYYRDLLAGQFYRKTTFLENPELAIANGSYGIDLALYYIQYYSYNVESMLVMFWAFELAQSVYGLSAKPHLRQVLRRINSVGKAIAILFPLLTILLLRAPAIQRVFVAFILLADLPLMISLAVSSITMIAILIRYVQSRKKISNWTPQGNDTAATTETSAETIQTTETADTSKSRKSQRNQGLYDRWLMVRFTVAFVILAVFEVTNTLFQLQSVNNNKKDATLAEPDYSVERARSTFFLYLPGVTPGIFLFLVFGTTAGCRTAIKGLLVPGPRKAHVIGRSRKQKLPDVETTDDAGHATDPFADTSEFDTKIEETEDNLPVSLPLSSLVSKYNKSFDRHQDTVDGRTPIGYQKPWLQKEDKKLEREGSNAVELRDISSLDGIRKEYYQPSPEESDDSGPVLPIMTHQRRIKSGSRDGASVPSSDRSV